MNDTLAPRTKILEHWPPIKGPSGQARARINVGESERWVSLAAGSMLVFRALTRPTPVNLLLGVLGGGLIHRGATGHCDLYEALNARDLPGSERTGGIRVMHAVTINRTPEELFRFWRDLTNLPRFMRHLDRVDILSGNLSRWVARAPAGGHVEWDAEIVAEHENEMIAWRSVEPSDVPNSGSVRFVPAARERGTEVIVQLEYAPPAGILGAGVAKLFGEEPSQQIEEDLRRFKQFMEAGEIATTTGQPRGQHERRQRRAT